MLYALIFGFVGQRAVTQLEESFLSENKVNGRSEICCLK